MDTKLKNTSISQESSASVETSTVENNGTTSTSQKASAITTTAMENKDETATTSLLSSAPPTSTTMSNITPVTSASTTIPPPAPLSSKLPSELFLPIYNFLLSMTITGLPPPILYALHGTPDYPLIQAQYKRINFVLSDATMPIFQTITHRGKKLKKILYLHIRSDDFTAHCASGCLDYARHPLSNHVCKLLNSFHKINFTAVKPPQGKQHSGLAADFGSSDAGHKIHTILHEICGMLKASDQAPNFCVKFLGFNTGKWDDKVYMYRRVKQVTLDLAAGSRKWKPRRELVGDDGVVHDSVVWIWEVV